MKLTPIEVLAKQAGIFVRAMHEKDTQHELICFRSISDLEQLRQAIISDFVNGLEPFGYFKAEPFSWTDCASDDDGAMPLFNLSGWRNK